MGGIYRWGERKIEIFRLFSDFLELNGQNWLVFSSKSRIRIQTNEFKFKYINQEATPHYSPPVPVTGGSASDTPAW
jgi:hypothetical protein